MKHLAVHARRIWAPWWTITLRLVPPLAVAVLLLVASGGVYWWLEPRTHSFADALWLAFVTASTVGYGDVVPSTAASKLFSVVVVLLGFAVLSLVTAAIATIWVESQERAIEREILNDLHAQVRGLREELRAERRAGATAPGDATAAPAGRRRSRYRPARSRARSRVRA